MAIVPKGGINLSINLLNIMLQNVTRSMLMTRSCCSLIPLAPFTLLTFTEVTGGRELAIFGPFLIFLFGCDIKHDKWLLVRIVNTNRRQTWGNCPSLSINDTRTHYPRLLVSVRQTYCVYVCFRGFPILWTCSGVNILGWGGAIKMRNTLQHFTISHLL